MQLAAWRAATRGDRRPWAEENRIFDSSYITRAVVDPLRTRASAPGFLTREEKTGGTLDFLSWFGIGSGSVLFVRPRTIFCEMAGVVAGEAERRGGVCLSRRVQVLPPSRGF